MKSYASVFATIVFFFACCSSDPLTAQSAGGATQSPHLLTVVIYKAGSEYRSEVPPDKQLVAHFDYVSRRFASGKLVAYGPQTDVFRGFYVLDTAEPTAVEEFIAHDPGVQKHLLQLDEKLVWATVIHNFNTAVPADSFFFIRMQPGAEWAAGKSLTEQAIGPHFGYMTDQAKSGLVLAAGPSSTGQEGLYIIKGTRSQIEALLANDPGEQSGLLKPVLLPWHVLSMQPLR